MPLSSKLQQVFTSMNIVSPLFFFLIRRVHFPFLPAVRGLQRGQRDPPAQDGSCARPGEDERPTMLEQTAFDLRNAELGQRTVRAAQCTCFLLLIVGVGGEAVYQFPCLACIPYILSFRLYILINIGVGSTTCNPGPVFRLHGLLFTLTLCWNPVCFFYFILIVLELSLFRRSLIKLISCLHFADFFSFPFFAGRFVFAPVGLRGKVVDLRGFSREKHEL